MRLRKEVGLKWERLIKVKDEVAKKLEVARANKEIGLSQEAQVTLFAEGDELEFLTGKEALLKETSLYMKVMKAF